VIAGGTVLDGRPLLRSGRTSTVRLPELTHPGDPGRRTTLLVGRLGPAGNPPTAERVQPQQVKAGQEHDGHRDGDEEHRADAVLRACPLTSSPCPSDSDYCHCSRRPGSGPAAGGWGHNRHDQSGSVAPCCRGLDGGHVCIRRLARGSSRDRTSQSVGMRTRQNIAPSLIGPISGRLRRLQVGRSRVWSPLRTCRRMSPTSRTSSPTVPVRTGTS